jgi:hypothetical protein
MSLVSKKQFQSALQQVQANADFIPKFDPVKIVEEASRPPPVKEKRPAVARGHTMPSVAEYRGTSALANIKTSKNLSDNARHTSLPLVEVKPDGHVHRQPNDITKHQVNALLTGSGNIFDRSLCTTSKGWKPGRFM